MVDELSGGGHASGGTSEPSLGDDSHREDTRGEDESRTWRSWTADALTTQVEDWIYVVVAVVLVALAAAVVVAGMIDFAEAVSAAEFREGALNLLDSVLLVLMIVEILHTVGISIRENVLVPQPFLIVGLIAAVRRILIITAEQAAPSAEDAVAFRLAMLELGLLTLLIVGLVVGIIALSRWRRPEERSTAGDHE